jgi:hypothetical protein
VTGGWRKLQNEELRDLYSSSGIIRNIKKRIMRWARRVARIGDDYVEHICRKPVRKETTRKIKT